MPRRSKKKQQELYLAALAGGATVKIAAEAGGFSRAAAYQWRNGDPAFAAAWDGALEAGTDMLEQEATRRAVDGIEQPVWHQGEQVGVERKYSDTLLIFLLKKRRPEFRDRQTVEMTGKDGGPLEIDQVVRAQDILVAKLAPVLQLRAAAGASGSDSG